MRIRPGFARGVRHVFTVVLLAACSGSEFQRTSGAGVSGGGAGGADTDGSVPGSGGRSGSGGTAGAGHGGLDPGGSANGGSSGTGGSPNGGVGGITSTGGTGTAGAGGAPGSTIQLSTAYDRACTYDSDCTLVGEGDVCGCPICDNAAIARTATAKWDADRKGIYCPLPTGPSACPAIACPSLLPACVNQLCVARRPVTIDVTTYDASCRADTDCMLIYGGEVCSTCRCQTAAVNVGAYAEYQKLVSSVQCTPPPSACDCAAQTQFSCVGATSGQLGRCTLSGVLPF